jgi:hypothetical protein
MSHIAAINCINVRVVELKNEIKKSELIIKEPEMQSDIYYAKADIANFEAEIKSLTNTLINLLKLIEQ